jgi:putative sugar O-methyltransferase
MQAPKIAAPSAILEALSAVRPLSASTVLGLCRLHAELVEDTQKHIALGWRPMGGEIHKSAHVLTPETLSEFAGHTFGGIGFEGPFDFLQQPNTRVTPGAPVEATSEALKQYRLLCKAGLNTKLVQVRDLAPELEKHWLSLIQEPASIGGPSIHLSGDATPFPITHHGIRVGYRAPVLAAWIDRPVTRLMEIGGGHGRFIRDAALLMPETKLILTDLPFNLIVSARYLIENFGHQVNLCLLPGQTFNPDSRINIIAPWRLDEISVPVDTACNFLSFQHMDETSLGWYGDAMRAVNVESVFQVNRNATRDPFDKALDDYPFASEFEAKRRQVLDTVSYIRSRTPLRMVDFEIVIELAHRRS